MTLITALSIMLHAQLVPVQSADVFHSVTGQSEILYAITARLDVDFHALEVSECVTYVNSASCTIETLCLYYNKYTTVHHVTCCDDTLHWMIRDGVLMIPLAGPLAQGDTCTFTITYRLDIPVHNGTFGYVPEHYEITDWYPRMCACDGAGWHVPLPGEEGTYEHDRMFASYDVKIDVPGDYIIAATGTQVDPAESLFMETYIMTGRKKHAAARRQAHFIARRVHDFVWVCDPYFIVQRPIKSGIALLFFARPYDTYTWDHLVRVSADVICRYERWFGELPYDKIAFVQGICQTRTPYPQIMFVTQSADDFTYLFESAIAADISKQWLGCAISTDRIQERWFLEGMATYAAIRYMDDRYGKDQSMIKSKMFPALSLRYFHRALYYLMNTNELEMSVNTLEADHDIPLAYTNSVSSKPALFFLSLERNAGRPVFTDIIRTFFSRGSVNPAHPWDFFEIYEEYTGEGMTSLYGAFVQSTAYCDWQVKCVTRNEVVIDREGMLPLATEMCIRTETDTLYYTIDPKPRTQTIIVPEYAGRIKEVAIDPSESLLDPYYWNNFYPRRIRIRPVISFEMPTFSTYDVYWLPYPWYDSYDGITANFYWFGDRFADFDFIKGGHQFLGGVIYGFKSKKAYVNVGYQTPLIFKKGIRVRVTASGSHNKHGNDASIGLTSALGLPLTSSTQTTIENRLVYSSVSSYTGLDSTDWSLGTKISLENSLRYRFAGWDVMLGISLSHSMMGSDWDYIRTTCAAQRTFPLVIPCKTRIFIGNVFGDAPEHERLYLCGGLRLNWFADLLFSQSGTLSPQEHIHVPGGGSMRGYQTLHLRSDQMYVCNLEVPLISVFRIFADVGYYDEFVFDAGVSLAISGETVSSLPLSGICISANVPLYTYTDEPWALRWSIGFSM